MHQGIGLETITENSISAAHAMGASCFHAKDARKVMQESSRLLAKRLLIRPTETDMSASSGIKTGTLTSTTNPLQMVARIGSKPWELRTGRRLAEVSPWK